MTVMPNDARARLPREPYPGLRPFLDFEAALLFGRERQVREVIARLRETQFVAVLGGSGSGKSSLIHAGVVPELRSFGIPGAGDLWLPLTCTPGTNVAAADIAARRHTPITRLARRFAGLLKSRGNEADDAKRLHEIADVFRQEAGFARLLDAYGAELAVPPGPDPAEARVLFVLDQFEEIFHPTNKGVEDATLLVERVLDHFFNPHPHCHVVLTMRSEHLNDCATFLELPDAINKSSYLIRRLDDQELRDAITGPAQRFLRLHARSAEAEGSKGKLPQEVHFEPKVLDRLLRDVKALTHDPDHLPLLQHLLARLWEAALEREEMDMPVPTHITEIDLVRAVAGGAAVAPGDEQPLDEKVNTLRACVENWPESIYCWHDEPQRAQLDGLFRHLAFKDPNTGLYSQQRIDVDVCAAMLGAGRTRAQVRALIAEGFLGSVDYLFWDDEDPARVTLKVSHESFIRGWSRFRRLIDVESEYFDEYLNVLRKCAAWVASQRSEDFLLETGEMRRLRDSRFEERYAQAGQREAWSRFLQMDRDGPKLAKLQGELDAYLAACSQRQRDREHKLKRSRLGWLALGAATLLLAPSAMFSVLIQAPVTQRAELLFDAGNRANRAPLTPDYPGVGAAAPALESLLRAAELVDDARTGQSFTMARISEWLLTHFAWIGAVHRQDLFLGGVAAQAEPPVNGKLRQLLSTAVWAGAPRGDTETPLKPPDVLSLQCEPRPGNEPGTGEALPGHLYVAAAPAGNTDTIRRRALFVPTWAHGRDTAIAIRGASYDTDSKACLYDQIVLSVPLYLDPHILFDAGLRYVAYTAVGANVDVPSVTVQELDWDRVEDKTSRVLQSQQRAVITGTQAVSRVQRAAGIDRVGVVETWRTFAGRALQVDDQVWRIVAPSALRLPAGPSDPRFVALLRSPAESACSRLATGWQPQPGFRNEMYEHRGHCYALTRGNSSEGAADGAQAGLREQVLVAVYERPERALLERLADNPPAPIASLSLFARVAEADREWLVGVSGEYTGWLAVRGKDLNGIERLLGAPWSTCALWRLGQQMRPPGSAVRAGVCSNG